jgi:hypothetical protein
VSWLAGRGSGITSRLSLDTTVHEERFKDGDLSAKIDAYDRRRAARRPFRNQRDIERFGRSDFYGWSEDKARQYAVPLRADFGAFVRAKGFRLIDPAALFFADTKGQHAVGFRFFFERITVWRKRFGMSMLVSGSVHSATIKVA